MHKKSIILTVISLLFLTNIGYSAQKDVLLKTTSTWDNVQYKKTKIFWLQF